MLELTSSHYWSYNYSESIVMFWRELIIFGRGYLIWLVSMGKAFLFTRPLSGLRQVLPLGNMHRRRTERATAMEVEDTTMAELLEQWTGAVLPPETLV
ncbi:hypothetical protein B296_00011846 [Ensete ventricosum]|uniref:Uncharacterized protein n=1 Tax=Ensete ventricosum TaxID=4639 RepID=A0A427A8W5_ENSVE|nr:hypothetical protein B296_00011846 [Ensete ventricosum]